MQSSSYKRMAQRCRVKASRTRSWSIRERARVCAIRGQLRSVDASVRTVRSFLLTR